MKILQRNFRESDLPAIVAFKQESARINFPGSRLDSKRFCRRLLKKAKAEPGTVRVFESNGEIVGYIWFERREDDFGRYGYVHHLFVRQDFRKRGLAKRMISCAERHLAGKGVKRVRLTVTKSNSPARRFYKKMHYKSTRIVMEKKL